MKLLIITFSATILDLAQLDTSAFSVGIKYYFLTKGKNER